MSTAASLTPFPDEAEDIYQDAMISAYKSLPKFRMESQFSTWLYRILVNTAISSRRKLKNKLTNLIFNDRTQHAEDIEQITFENYASANNPEADLLNQQLSKAITQALLSLSDQEKTAFVLCHQQQFKINQAANIMACSEGTVKSYLFRAREKMQAQLIEYRS